MERDERERARCSRCAGALLTSEAELNRTGLMAIGTPGRRVVAGVIALLASVAALAYWIGTTRSAASEYVGDAYSTELQIGIRTDDWSYDVPLDVRWTDSTGQWHEGSRPECLPPERGSLSGIRFAAVPVETRGIGFRQVVAVFCD